MVTGVGVDTTGICHETTVCIQVGRNRSWEATSFWRWNNGKNCERCLKSGRKTALTGRFRFENKTKKQEANFFTRKCFKSINFPFSSWTWWPYGESKKTREKTQEVSPLTFSWGRLTQGSTTQECFTCQVIDPCWIGVLVAGNLVVRAGTANELVLTQTSWSDPNKKWRNKGWKSTWTPKKKTRCVFSVFGCIP